jgi:hypothetical protein
MSAWRELTHTLFGDGRPQGGHLVNGHHASVYPGVRFNCLLAACSQKESYGTKRLFAGGGERIPLAARQHKGRYVTLGAMDSL